MQPLPNSERLCYLRAVEQEAAARGPKWLASVLRPTGQTSVAGMTTQQLKICLDNFYTGGHARPGVPTL